LLRIAREAVRLHFLGHGTLPPALESDELALERSVFVSIHQEGELRGCIGSIQPTSPLFQSTAQCAIAAAVRDPRFAPVIPSELPFVHFEISVLSDVERVRQPLDIEVGRHGLIIGKGDLKGLLLPQVAARYRWSPERFLAETCHKAGLPPDEWKNGATVYCFEADVFSESHTSLASHP
jgi:AmmeMemoRadiSam system protein A